MLSITLYQNCCLTNEYKEVFSLANEPNSNYSVLKNYLDGLTKISVDADCVYQENEGTLIFSSEILNNPYDIYKFNYMLVRTIDEDDNEIFRRYCFIDKIIIKNDVVLLDYSEDIWHSYVDGISGISKSYLISSRILNYTRDISLPVLIKPYSLPVEFNGNNLITYESIYPTIGGYNVFIEIQHYSVGQSGEVTFRQSDIYLLSKVSGDTNLNSSEIYDILYKIIAGAAKENTFEESNGATSLFFNFEIGKIYGVPQSFNFGETLPAYMEYYLYDNSLTKVARLYKISNTTDIIYSNYYGITNPKLISIGTLTNQVELIFNGTEIGIKAGYSKYMSNFGIYLSISNSIYDFTDDFLIEMPIEQLSSEELSLLKLQRQIKIQNDQNSIELSKRKYFLEGIKGVSDAVNSAMSGAHRFNIGSAVSGAISSVTSAQISRETETYNQKVLEREITLLNAPLYSSTKGIITNNSNNMLNIFKGFVGFYINSDNDEYVKRCIREYGFNSYQFISSLNYILFNNPDLVRSKGYNYNTIRFSNITLYGSFTQKIAKELKNIFETGIKIWYNSNREEDLHVDI